MGKELKNKANICIPARKKKLANPHRRKNIQTDYSKHKHVIKYKNLNEMIAKKIQITKADSKRSYQRLKNKKFKLNSLTIQL